MAVNYTENQLKEMRERAIASAREMQRRSKFAPQQNMRPPEKPRQEPLKNSQQQNTRPPERPLREQTAPIAGGDKTQMQTGRSIKQEPARYEPMRTEFKKNAQPAGSGIKGNFEREKAAQPNAPQGRRPDNMNARRNRQAANTQNQNNNSQNHRNFRQENNRGKHAEKPPAAQAGRTAAPPQNGTSFFRDGMGRRVQEDFFPDPKEVFKREKKTEGCSDCVFGNAFGKRTNCGTAPQGSANEQDDFMLIFSLLMLLMSEGADKTLIFTLMYMLM